ncbi:hypothetical protein F383_33191 [Gossypium arboreum]|uniref:Uncharacterized protein n=1 Tax=Gossypium arboreum TaxID=29729 RepID=A0A0B0MWT0_GOSAR|nr:hypothetical protein F383_33191 [Gossypium arboreum]
MSQTWFTLVHISTPMSCPRHGLTLALIMWLMPCSKPRYETMK